MGWGAAFPSNGEWDSLYAADLACTRALGCTCAGAAPAASNSSPSPAPPATWDGTAVVIVDHGSRRAASNAQLDEMVAMYK